MTIALKPLLRADLATLYDLAYTKDREWLNWNGPYFHDPTPDRDAYLQKDTYLDPVRAQGILVDGQLVGMVTAFFDDGALARWREVGLAIFASDQWHRGIGTQALHQWLDVQFAAFDLPHMGLTTWSGNRRMIRLATRLGLQEEARIRQVRYWQGRYYDSVRFGVLRQEWTSQRK